MQNGSLSLIFCDSWPCYHLLLTGSRHVMWTFFRAGFQVASVESVLLLLGSPASQEALQLDAGSLGVTSLPPVLAGAHTFLVTFSIKPKTIMFRIFFKSFTLQYPHPPVNQQSRSISKWESHGFSPAGVPGSPFGDTPSLTTSRPVGRPLWSHQTFQAPSKAPGKSCRVVAGFHWQR